MDGHQSYESYTFAASGILLSAMYSALNQKEKKKGDTTLIFQLAHF